MVEVISVQGSLCSCHFHLPDVYQLLELPPVRQGGHQVGQLVLVALEHPVDVVAALAGHAVVALL